MPLPAGVPPEQAAEVFRRAAELEAAGSRGDGPLLDDRDLEGGHVAPWRLLSGRALVLTTVGIGAGGVLLATAVTGPFNVPDWQYDLAGSLSALAGAGAALRSYRRGVGAVEAALDTFLDRLAGGAATVVHLPAPAERPAPSGI